MTEYSFFLQKADQWRKDMALMWGDINICPLLHWFQLPCHSQAELSSLNGLKAWGDRHKLHHDITFFWYWQRRRIQGAEIMVYQPYG